MPPIASRIARRAVACTLDRVGPSLTPGSVQNAPVATAGRLCRCG